MANFRWRGGAATQTQLNTITFSGGPWTGDGVGVTFTLTAEDGPTTEAQVVDVTAAWTDTQVRDAVLTAVQGATTPMFQRVTWASSGGAAITATAKTAGVPFYLGVTESDTAGAAANVATTVNRGPNDVNTDGANGNWVDETGAATTKPAANGDVDVLPHPTEKDAAGNPKCHSLLYGLNQSSINLLRLNIPKSFKNATVGDPASGFYLRYDVNQATSAVIIASEANAIWLRGTRLKTYIRRFKNESLRFDGTDTTVFMLGPECAGTARWKDGSIITTYHQKGCPQVRALIGTSGTAMTTAEVKSGFAKIDRAITTAKFGGPETQIEHTAGTISNYENDGATVKFNGTGNLGTIGGGLSKHNDGILSFQENMSPNTINMYNAVMYAGTIIDTGGLVNVLYWTDNGVTSGVKAEGGHLVSDSGTVVAVT